MEWKTSNLSLIHILFFYYGISAVLMAISLLHIINSMQYLVLARKREFGILRAMGITDAEMCIRDRCWGAKLFGAAANAISIPPGEYVRKNETQRNRRGPSQAEQHVV